MADDGAFPSREGERGKSGSPPKGGIDAQFRAFTLGLKLPVNFLYMLESLEYNGLDVIKMMKEARALLAKAGYAEASHEDIFFGLVIYFAKRGSNVSDLALDRTGAEAAKWLKTMLDALGIKSRLKDCKHGISLARLAAAFPHVMLFLHFIQQGRVVGDYTGKDMPIFFAYSGSPSMMTDEEWIAWKDDYLEHMTKMHRIINAKNAKELEKTDERVSSEQENYANIMRSAQANRSLLRDRRVWVDASVDKYVDTFDKSFKGKSNFSGAKSR